MKTFKFTTIAFFQADNIDHACSLISEHFRAISNGEDSDLFGPGTDIEIIPVEDENQAHQIEIQTT